MYLNNIMNLIKEFLHVLSPFLSSIIIAFLLYPLVNKFNTILDKIHKFKTNRIISIVFSYLIFIGFLVFICVFVLPDVFVSIGDIISKTPEYFEQFKQLLLVFSIDIQDVDFSIIESFLINKSQELLQDITTMAPNIFNMSKNIIGTIFSSIISFAFSIYILVDLNRISNFLNYAGNVLFGKEKHEKIRKVILECTSSINGFLIGKIIDSTIIAIIIFIILNIGGFKYCLLISFIIGITNIIPDVGPFIGAIPSFLIYLAISPKQAFIFLVIIICLQQFDGMFLGPKILGHKLGVRPILILPSVIIGGYYFGILGMILGVPFISVFSTYFNNFLKKKELSQKERIKKDEKEDIT